MQGMKKPCALTVTVQWCRIEYTHHPTRNTSPNPIGQCSISFNTFLPACTTVTLFDRAPIYPRTLCALVEGGFSWLAHILPDLGLHTPILHGRYVIRMLYHFFFAALSSHCCIALYGKLPPSSFRK